jgi:inorganic pyrophosphatase
VIEGTQTSDDDTCRNDRLIAIATHAHIHDEAKAFSDLDQKIVDEIEQFFVSYNKMEGHKFKPMGRYGPKRALKLLKEGINKSRKAKNKKRKRSSSN